MGSESKEGWKDVERRFDEMNKAGRIPKESFGKCIGMGDSEEFAGELLLAWSRRRHVEPDKGMNKDQLKELWEEITDHNLDSRLRIFFDMCDKNGDMGGSRKTMVRENWMHLIFPALLSACQGIIRKFRWNNQSMIFAKVAIYPGNVLCLGMHKPRGFKHKSGMHLFIKCTDVTPSEWHPFPITSAPGDGYLTVHIRTVGDWASQLGNEFAKCCQPPAPNETAWPFPTVYIDGPYGASSQNYKNYDIVLFIGLGFGITAFISVLKDIVNNIYPTDEVESTHGSEVKNNWPGRAYFYWVTGEQESFDCFKWTMNEVADLDHSNVIEIHNYLTSVFEEGDARSTIIAMLQSLQHAKTGLDVISGSKIWTHFARPNWRRVFSRLANTHKNSHIGIFYCGSPTLTKQLKDLSTEFSQATTTRFHFHNENPTIQI